MTHEFWEEQILLYVTNDLDANGVAVIEAHLIDCKSCQTSVREWEAIGLAAKGLKKQKTQQKKQWNMRRVSSRVASIAVLFILGGLLVMLQIFSSDDSSVMIETITPNAVTTSNLIKTPTPNPDSTNLELARLAYWGGDLERSVFYYEKALLDDPNNTEAHYEYVRVLIYRGEETINYEPYTAQALTYAEPIANKFPQDKYAQSAYAYALVANGHAEEASDISLVVVNESPDFALGYAIQAFAAYDSGLFSLAESAANTALNLDNSLIEAHRAVALSLAYDAQRSRALDLAWENDYEDVKNQIQQAINLHPRLIPSYYELTKYQVDFDDYSGALDTLNRLLSIAPENSDAWVAECTILDQYFSDSERAAISCNKAIELDETNVSAYNRLGNMRLYRFDDTTGAIAAYAHCINLMNTQGWPHDAQFGDCYFTQGMAYDFTNDCSTAIPLLFEGFGHQPFENFSPFLSERQFPNLSEQPYLENVYDLSLRQRVPCHRRDLDSNGVSPPEAFNLFADQISYQYQDGNNQGLATLATGLNFLGQNVSHADISAVLKPHTEDVSISFTELSDYVSTYVPSITALHHVGGDFTTLKQLISNNYPVLIRVGHEFDEASGFNSRYLLLVGYNNTHFFVFDGSEDVSLPETYEMVSNNWWMFGNEYLVLYPSTAQSNVIDIIGTPDQDNTDNVQLLERVQSSLNHRLNTETADSPWDWFNAGEAFAALGKYEISATFFRRAIRQGLPAEAVWFRHTPLEVFYQIGDYQTLDTLITNALATSPHVEELYYYQDYLCKHKDMRMKPKQHFNKHLSSTQIMNQP